MAASRARYVVATSASAVTRRAAGRRSQMSESRSNASQCVREASTDSAIPSNTTVPAHWTVDAGRAFIDRQGKRITSGEGISLAMHELELNRAVGLVSLMLRPQPSVIGRVLGRSERTTTRARSSRGGAGQRLGHRSRRVCAYRGVGRARQPSVAVRAARGRLRAGRAAEIVPGRRRFEIRRTGLLAAPSRRRLTRHLPPGPPRRHALVGNSSRAAHHGRSGRVGRTVRRPGCRLRSGCRALGKVEGQPLRVGTRGPRQAQCRWRRMGSRSTEVRRPESSTGRSESARSEVTAGPRLPIGIVAL